MGGRIAKAELERLVEAASLAPSCFNMQPWRFIVARGEQALASVKAGLKGGNRWADPAPAIVAVVSRADLDCQLKDGREYYLFDSGMAAENLMLQATQQGLIAHPIAGFDSAKVRASLNIPDDYLLICLIVIGRAGDPGQLPDEELQKMEVMARQRKPLKQVLAWDTFDFDD